MQLINNYISYFSRQYYSIGFIEGEAYKNATNLSQHISWLQEKEWEGHWYADPFILSVSKDKVEVLVEEFSVKESKGVISKLNVLRTSNGTFTLQSKKTLLLDKTHFSFPYIIRDENKIYVCPENYQSGGVYLYEYNVETETLSNKKLIIDVPLVDTQIVKINTQYYAFGVETITGKRSESRCLKIYSSQSLWGPFVECQTITNKKNEERGAGCIFMKGGRIIRPAQCSEGRYGKEIILYELSLRNGMFIEKEIRRYRQGYFCKNGVSLHTINNLNDIAVVDGLDYYNCPFFSRIIEPVNKFILALLFEKYRR